jgi:hypothetical protein
MRFKKSFIILIVFLLLISIFNFNTISSESLNYEINNSSYYDEYIIELNEEPVFSFVNQLIKSAKTKLTDFSKIINISSFLKEVKNYKKNLQLMHKKVKGEISTTIDFKGNLNKLFNREYFDLFNGLSIKRISDKLILRIKNLPFVKDVYPDNKIYATLDESVPKINADDVWKIKDSLEKNLTGEGITIAFLDSGVDYNHVDLKDNYISEGSYDFVNNDTDPMDDNGHGTHVTGIAVGKGIESNYQYVGVAPDAKFYSFKILDHNGEGNFSTYYDAMMRALDPNNDGDYSDKVDIISLSLGTKKPGSPDDNLCEILDNVVDAGIIVVAAAGNLGPNSNTITSPGCAKRSICVGSTNKYDIIASSSSRGPVEWDNNSLQKPDILAPGVNIKSTKKSGGYEINSGTSMATPHISGAAALLIQKDSQLNPTELKKVLLESSKDLGYEMNSQGYGRIDVLAAIEPNNQFIIKAPEIVSEAEIFKIQILDSNDNPTRVWTFAFIPFHIPRLKYGHSRKFIAPMVLCKNKEYIKGKIIAFKFHGGFQMVKKDIIVLNRIRVNN